MKRGTRRLVSIGLDVLCLVIGFPVTLLAHWGGYDGTLAIFWFIKLALGTTLVLVAGIVSSLLPGEGTVHRWVRFALFELLTLQLTAEFIVRQGGGPTSFETTMLPLLVDAAVYGVGLQLGHLFARAPGPTGLSR